MGDFCLCLRKSTALVEYSSMPSNPNIVVMGGGSGSFAVLEGLKTVTTEITAVVNMSDDGGSSGIIRDELGAMPGGDIRQCLVALSPEGPVKDLFNHRFGGEGTLAGQSLGNFILAAFEAQQDDFVEAVRAAGALLQITGQVLPVSTDKHTLMLNDGGEVIRGEHIIDHRAMLTRNPLVYTDPPAGIHPDASSAIGEADLVVFAPGSLYTSLLPIMSIGGVKEALRDTAAEKVVISNLMNKPGQTEGLDVVDYVQVFERYLGKGLIDHVLYNNQTPSTELIEKYTAEGELPVLTDGARFTDMSASAIGAPLIATEVRKLCKEDKNTRRALIRHDGHKVAEQLLKIL